METMLHFGKGLGAPEHQEGSARRKLGQALAGSGALHAERPQRLEGFPTGLNLQKLLFQLVGLPSAPARLLSCVCSSKRQLALHLP